jgi:hypothetical protein
MTVNGPWSDRRTSSNTAFTGDRAGDDGTQPRHRAPTRLARRAGSTNGRSLEPSIDVSRSTNLRSVFRAQRINFLDMSTPTILSKNIEWMFSSVIYSHFNHVLFQIFFTPAKKNSLLISKELKKIIRTIASQWIHSPIRMPEESKNRRVKPGREMFTQKWHHDLRIVQRKVSVLVHWKYLVSAIDYRCEDRIWFGELKGEIGAITYILTLYFKNPDNQPPKNEPFSQEMHLKIPLLRRGSNFSNSKPGCSLSSSLLCEIDTTNGFLTWSSFRWVLFQLLILGLTPVSLLKAKRGLKSSRNFWTPENKHLHIYSLWSQLLQE